MANEEASLCGDNQTKKGCYTSAAFFVLFTGEEKNWKSVSCTAEGLEGEKKKMCVCVCIWVFAG